MSFPCTVFLFLGDGLMVSLLLMQWEDFLVTWHMESSVGRKAFLAEQPVRLACSSLDNACFF